MYGADPACVFLVFCNPGDGGDEALDHWYMKVHGPDAIENGSFTALHRYQACGDYPARFLAVWEGNFTTMDAARGYIAPRAAGLRAEGRVTEDMTVVWALMAFLRPTPAPTPAPTVNTVTLVQGPGPVDAPVASRAYRYDTVVLYESPEAPDVTAPKWSDAGREGMPDRGAYNSIFNEPVPGAPAPPPLDATWVSHWRPIGSLR